MAGGIGGAGGSGGLGSGGLGSSGGIGMSIAASTPTDFSAQTESDAAAASSSSANAQVSTSFDASASMNDFGSSMALLDTSVGDQPYGGPDVTQWKPQRPDEEPTPPAAAMQPSDDVLAQICAAYSSNQM